MVMPILALMTMGKMAQQVGPALKARAEDRAFDLEQRQRTRDQWKRDDDLRTSMTNAAKPVSVEDGSVYQPSVDDEGNAMPANPTAGRLKVGGKTFTDPAQAQDEAARQSTMPASMRRQAGALQGAGKLTEAQQLSAAAKKLEEEGVLDVLDRNIKRLPSVDDIRNGKGVDFDIDGVADYNANGKDRLPEGAKGRAKVLKLPNGQEIADFEVVGADGKVLLPSARKVEALYGYSRAERERADREMYGQGKTIEHQGTMQKLQERGVAVQETNAANTAEYHRGMLGVAQRNAATAERTAKANAAAKEPVAETPENTFDRKLASDIAKDLVKKEAEEAAIGGKPMSAAAVARRTDELVNAQFVTHQNRFIATNVQRSLTAASSDPAEYSAAYGKALKLMPQAELLKLGFKPPAGSKTPAGAAPTVQPAITMDQLQAQLRAEAAAKGQGAPASPAAAGAPGAAVAAPASAPAAADDSFGALLTANVMTPHGKAKIAQHVKANLPATQQAVLNAAQQAQNEALSPNVRNVMKARAEQMGREAQMMQAFMDANPNLFQ
jgi:hypothetical protein